MLNLLIGLECSGSGWVVSSHGVAPWQAVQPIISMVFWTDDGSYVGGDDQQRQRRL